MTNNNNAPEYQFDPDAEAFADSLPQEPETPKPKKVNRSALVRECVRRHPNWSYAQIKAYILQVTGQPIADTTISRAKICGLNAPPVRLPKTKHAEMIRRSIDPKGIQEAMASCVTKADWQRLTRKLFEMAMAGDLKAYEHLTNRIMGKPSEHVVEEKKTTTVNWGAYSAEELDLLERLLTKGQVAALTHVEADVIDAEVIDMSKPAFEIRQED